MSIADEKRVKFTSFDTYCLYNVLCLTFKRNPDILIERKILEAISRKNKGLTKPRRIDENKAKDRMVVHHAAQRCYSHRDHPWSGARPCICQCVGARPAMRRCTGVQCLSLRSFMIFRPLYIVFSSYFGETSWVAFHERQLGFRIPPKTPLGGDKIRLRDCICLLYTSPSPRD